MGVKAIVRGEAGGLSRAFELSTQIVIVVSIVALTLDTMPEIRGPARRALAWIEYFSIAFFSLEYALRVYAANPRTSYIFSFWGVIDLLAVAPSLLMFGPDLRALRALRMLRLLRLFKLARTSNALDRLALALREIRSELTVFGVLSLIVFYLSAAGIYYFENQAQPETFASIPASMWWAVVTLTTVGYGDVFPVTIGGKMFTFIVLMVGLGLVAIPTGLISASLQRTKVPPKTDKPQAS